MATDESFAIHAYDQLKGIGDVSYRKMFGEYAIYVDGKVVALLADNQCFVKPTAEGRAFLGTVEEAPPYPGAKHHFLVTDLLDDRQRLSTLVRITADATPAPKKKPAKTGAKKVSKKVSKSTAKKASKPMGKTAPKKR